MCWAKLKGLLCQKRFKKVKSLQELESLARVPPEEPVLTQVKKSRDERWLERHPLMKLVSSSREEPNAPKKQPCPLGHGWKKRVGKAMGGALYWCNVCQDEFLVPYPKR